MHTGHSPTAVQCVQIIIPESVEMEEELPPSILATKEKGGGDGQPDTRSLTGRKSMSSGKRNLNWPFFFTSVI